MYPCALVHAMLPVHRISDITMGPRRTLPFFFVSTCHTGGIPRVRDYHANNPFSIAKKIDCGLVLCSLPCSTHRRPNRDLRGLVHSVLCRYQLCAQGPIHLKPTVLSRKLGRPTTLKQLSVTIPRNRYVFGVPLCGLSFKQPGTYQPGHGEFPR